MVENFGPYFPLMFKIKFVQLIVMKNGKSLKLSPPCVRFMGLGSITLRGAKRGRGWDVM